MLAKSWTWSDTLKNIKLFLPKIVSKGFTRFSFFFTAISSAVKDVIHEKKAITYEEKGLKQSLYEALYKQFSFYVSLFCSVCSMYHQRMRR